ncbi:hypothetical protein BpHYR1_024499 [Brachionus plicatilis]|uniref:Uncharacterized protein n=1 Tax=Brachionus plicatilis TaxID=10195 RepID=A0A3M7R253_BRAPC|nr:hypothetical protein BpHYR1_024499 [Brachionus plicatilis]
MKRSISPKNIFDIKNLHKISSSSSISVTSRSLRKTAGSELGSACKMVALNETDYDDLESDAEKNSIKLKKQ